MKVEEYAKQGIVLRGLGRVRELKLDQSFFEEQQREHGPISDVVPIILGVGGYLFAEDNMRGCLIVFESGKYMVVESDGEYIDRFLCEDV